MTAFYDLLPPSQRSVLQAGAAAAIVGSAGLLPSAPAATAFHRMHP